jgi:hypothetical protein
MIGRRGHNLLCSPTGNQPNRTKTKTIKQNPEPAGAAGARARRACAGERRQRCAQLVRAWLPGDHVTHARAGRVRGAAAGGGAARALRAVRTPGPAPRPPGTDSLFYYYSYPLFYYCSHSLFCYYSYSLCGILLLRLLSYAWQCLCPYHITLHYALSRSMGPDILLHYVVVYGGRHRSSWRPWRRGPGRGWGCRRGRGWGQRWVWDRLPPSARRRHRRRRPRRHRARRTSLTTAARSRRRLVVRGSEQ